MVLRGCSFGPFQLGVAMAEPAMLMFRLWGQERFHFALISSSRCKCYSHGHWIQVQGKGTSFLVETSFTKGSGFSLPWHLECIAITPLRPLLIWRVEEYPQLNESNAHVTIALKGLTQVAHRRPWCRQTQWYHIIIAHILWESICFTPCQVKIPKQKRVLSFTQLQPLIDKIM